MYRKHTYSFILFQKCVLQVQVYYINNHSNHQIAFIFNVAYGSEKCFESASLLYINYVSMIIVIHIYRSQDGHIIYNKLPFSQSKCRCWILRLFL